MSVASKNLFALLGNDADGDSEPPAPVKTVDKTSTHTAKRNTDGAAPAKGPVVPSRRGGGVSGSEAAFRDRNAGSDRNRGKPATEEAGRGGPRGGSGARGRGGRGARHARPADERHSKGLPSGGSDKTAAQAWGSNEGQAELKDEQAGEEQAKAEQKEAAVEGDAAATPAVEEEEEDKHVSYADYVVQQAEKKAALEAEAALRLRKANEGIKEDKKWANAKALPKEDGEDYFAASGGKAKRERERKVKQVVEIDQRFVEPAHTGGGRDGARGGRGGPRGGARGDGARGGGRGRGAPRGEFRGPRGGRGETAAAPRASANTNLNPTDESAFPSLGSK